VGWVGLDGCFEVRDAEVVLVFFDQVGFLSVLFGMWACLFGCGTPHGDGLAFEAAEAAFGGFVAVGSVEEQQRSGIDDSHGDLGSVEVGVFLEGFVLLGNEGIEAFDADCDGNASGNDFHKDPGGVRDAICSESG